MRKNDPRVLLEEKGPSTFFSAQNTIEGRKMTAYAHRTGTKNAPLTMAKNVEGVAHDCVIDTQNKNKNSNNEFDDMNTKKALTFRFFGK